MEMREKKMKVAGNLGDGPFLADAPTFSWLNLAKYSIV
jgi:hypothetical protein